MQEELRRINTIGDSNGILHFASTVLKGDEIKRESARQICSFVNDMQINFNGAVAFFECLGFISISANSLIPTDKGKKLYSLLGGGFEEMLCMACLNKIIADTILDTNALRFDVVKERYHILKHGFPIPSSTQTIFGI